MKWLATLFLGTLATGALLLRAQPPREDPGPAALRPPADASRPWLRFQWQGAASCAASGCHNANQPGMVAGSEYTIWISRDPHARAYEVLFNARSEAISRNLRNADPSGVPPAPENVRCLSCHVHPDYKKADHHRRFSPLDGVGCESCHGPAEKWLTEHSRPAWRALTEQAKKERGLRDTKSVAGRAAVCVDCHVGAPGMEVNHDLIAAGHPRLNFEFSVYHANLPHHWSDAKDRDPVKTARGRRDFEAAAWAVGQVVSARAALDLLAERAAPENGRPWPELAEFDCFACHHNLQAKSKRQSRQHYRGRPPGAMPWNDWYDSTALDEILSSVSKNPVTPGSPQRDLRELRGVMERKAGSERGAIAEQARRASRSLAAVASGLEKTRYSTKQIRDLMERLSRAEGPRSTASWDNAEQTYLALNALYHGWKQLAPPGGPPPLGGPLNKLSRLLRFCADRDSPRAAFTGEAVRARCRAVLELLRKPGRTGD